MQRDARRPPTCGGHVTSTWRQITGSVSCNSIRTVAIASKLDILIVDAREHIGGQPCGSISFKRAVWINVYMMAARSPPRSEPANSSNPRGDAGAANRKAF